MSTPSTLPTLEFETEKLFESWLAKNHSTSSGIWLKIFKKGSARLTVSYAQALDVALCYGWIDSQKKTFDEDAWIQRFTPRGTKSTWSKVNSSHVERLIAEGRMRPPGLRAVEAAKHDGRWQRAYDSPRVMSIPNDFLDQLKANKPAEAFFSGLNKANLYAIGFRLQTAKKQETREKRIKEIIRMLANGETLH